MIDDKFALFCMKIQWKKI